MSIRKCNGHFYVEPSLTSRDTRTEFQNPSVPKTYLVGSNHHAEQWYKNEVKKSNHSGDILRKRIKLCRQNFGAKTQEPNCQIT